ncbi:MAG TPA: hypothetical protein VEJ63_13690, partial [Planctomycetota bacterium]|nr:hypothetical protein [Planctomycetota bacterium]
MSGRLVLLAEDSIFAELRAAGSLQFNFVQYEASSQQLPSEADPERLVHLHVTPDLLLPPPVNPASDREQKIDHEGLQELYSDLLGSTVCHVALIRRESAQQDLLDLRAFYERFRSEAAKRLGHRADSFQHALILIFAGPAENKALPILQDIIGGEAERLPQRTYVMFDTLELGRNTPFFSHYIWPLSVSRLLLRLSLGERLDEEGPRAYAWRGFDFGPNLEADWIDSLVTSSLAAVYKRLLNGDGAISNVHAEHFRPAPVTVSTLQLTPREQTFEPQPWQEFQAQTRLKAIAPMHAWHDDFAATGRKFATTLGVAAMEDEPPAQTEARNIWRAVHKEPSNITRALLLRELLDGPGLEEHARLAREQWQKMEATIARRIQELADFQACAEEFERAQSAFVSFGPRLAIGAIASAFVAYASSVVIHAMIGGVWWPTIVAGSIALGGLAGAVIPWWLENRRGKRALSEFQSMLKRVYGLTNDINIESQRLLAQSQEFSAQLRAQSEALQLKALLRRVKWMLDTELQPQTASIQSGQTASAGQPSERLERQRREFLALTSSHWETGSRKTLEDDVLENIVKDAADRFEKLWSKFCELDPEATGYLPSHTLLPLLNNFRQSVVEAIRAELA